MRSVLLYRAKSQTSILYVDECIVRYNILTPKYDTDSEDPSVMEESTPMCACCLRTEEFPTPMPSREFFIAAGRMTEVTTSGQAPATTSTANKSRSATSRQSYA